MINECLKFGDLCDYYENNINDQTMIDTIVKHLEACDDCKHEFIRLKNMFEILHEYSCNDSECKDISDLVIKKLKFRIRKRKVMHSIPAVAAAILLFVGATYYMDGFNVSNDPITISTNKSHVNTEQVIDILNNNNAKLVNVTDLYIEGEIVYTKFNQLKRDLGTRQVTSTLAQKSRLDVRNNWRRGIEEVGTTIYQDTHEPTIKYIRFKVYK